MSIGAERADARNEADWIGPEMPEDSPDFAFVEPESQAAGTSAASRILAVFLVLLALAWLGACAWTIWRAPPPAELRTVLDWIVTVSIPLILLGLVWLLFGRSSRRETEKFAHAVAALRRESQTLDSVLAIVGGRLEENRVRVSEEAARLMTLGEETSDRLGRVTHYLARETAELDRKAQALESAAEHARVDLGVLMGDLPRAEEQARAVAAAIQDAGAGALEQAGALEAQLSALLARGREADEIASGAAQRLGAQLGRIESSAGAAGERIEQASGQMNAAVDGAMGRASDSVEEVRAALAAQGEAMLAMVDQGRAAFEEAGAEASRRLAERLVRIGDTLDALATKLDAQDTATRTLVGSLTQEIEIVEQRVSALGESGEATHGRLVQAVETVRGSVARLAEEMASGDERAGALIDRTGQMADGTAALARQLREELAVAFAEAEAGAERTAARAAEAVAPAEALQSAATLAADSVGESEAGIARQRESLDALLAALQGGMRDAEEQLRAVGGAIADTDRDAAKLVQETGPELLDALVRVREAAGQAAAHAREAIAGAIPEGAAALGEASRAAVADAVTAPVRDQLALLAQLSEGAVAAARTASERLSAQLLAIGRTATALESRMDEDRAARAEKEGEALSRRVSLLIEALNSTAIDVTKILSNEVTDSAWAAYLKGDRGVFTRRAVRLLDSGEAREILRHYEEEPEFRDQVNRYVADFEALLTRILADRDGHALAVTLLSSDVGKLYVALAQAIDRLRR